MHLIKRLWQTPTERPPPSRAPPGNLLDQTLLYLSPVDGWTVRDACEGVQIFGAIGSGKTTGSGAAIAKAYLRAGFGGIVMASKPEERQLWETYARETGREKSMVIVSPAHPWKFSFLDYELRREERGAGQTENIVNLLSIVVELVEGKVEQSGDGAFWTRAMQEMLRNAIDLLSLAQGKVTLEDISQLIADAPQSLEHASDPTWQAASFCAACLKLADEKKNKTPREVHDFETAARYWLKYFPAMSDRTRSGVVATFTGVADLLQHGLAHELLGTATNIVPEVTYKEGAIIVLDLPIQEYQQVGRVVQGIWKLMFQRAILRRNVEDYPRPVFLWADEAQNFVSSFDYQVQAVARSARLCTVYLTQNISNYYAVLGSRARDSANALLGNFNTKIFHANTDHATNHYAAEIIAQQRTTSFSFNSGASQGGASHSAGGSDTIRYKVMPAEFTTLRKGGPANQLQVEAVLFQGGRVWKATGDTYIKTVFHQS